MKVIFLDIDGVLNHADWLTEHRNFGLDHLDPAAVARVQRICDATGAHVVISSTWRLVYSLGRLRDMLYERGLRARVVGETPHLPAQERGDEIQLWLDRTPARRGWELDGIVILDDDRDMRHLDPWLVRTAFATGITDADVERAVEMLSRSMPARKAG